MGGVADAIGGYVDIVALGVGSLSAVTASIDSISPAASKLRHGDVRGAIDELGSEDVEADAQASVEMDLSAPAPRSVDSDESIETGELSGDATGDLKDRVEAAQVADTLADRVLDD
ncbi:MAG: hypothetical protein ABEL76_15185 [Bradymonadaceae bacterium]